jgi:hypothetical protein
MHLATTRMRGTKDEGSQQRAAKLCVLMGVYKLD